MRCASPLPFGTHPRVTPLSELSELDNHSPPRPWLAAADPLSRALAFLEVGRRFSCARARPHPRLTPASLFCLRVVASSPHPPQHRNSPFNRCAMLHRRSPSRSSALFSIPLITLIPLITTSIAFAPLRYGSVCLWVVASILCLKPPHLLTERHKHHPITHCVSLFSGARCFSAAFSTPPSASALFGVARCFSAASSSAKPPPQVRYL